MSLEDLYREIILDHYRNPRNRGDLPSPPAMRVEGFNPLCGDEVVLYVDLEHVDSPGPDSPGAGGEGSDRVADIRISGQGCSISQSSASMMSAAVKGRTSTEARNLIRAFKAMMSIHEHRLDGDGHEVVEAVAPDPEVKLGDLEALRGVVKFPVRIKCATLSWNTLAQALDEARTGQVPSSSPPGSSSPSSNEDVEGA